MTEVGEAAGGKSGGGTLKSSVMDTPVFEIPVRHPTRDIKASKIFFKNWFPQISTPPDYLIGK